MTAGRDLTADEVAKVAAFIEVLNTITSDLVVHFNPSNGRLATGWGNKSAGTLDWDTDDGYVLRVGE